ncbi:MAG: hypothetical protein KJO95_13085 [Gammaproteobacteria bacterium]|nr:hypothetical protein [Gammaproteobacteria bacterium]MBU2675780.1 hypothetical protein [Gammaproteobacteria bacterium]NNL49518.1 hypothetical protein [Woeseiaceae bacterium]
MSPVFRLICTLVLLLVVSGQVSVAAHAASHVGADAGECALCAGYADPTAVTPTKSVVRFEAGAHRPGTAFLSLAKSSSTVLCNHTRGPPPRIL